MPSYVGLLPSIIDIKPNSATLAKLCVYILKIINNK